MLDMKSCPTCFGTGSEDINEGLPKFPSYTRIDCRSCGGMGYAKTYPDLEIGEEQLKLMEERECIQRTKLHQKTMKLVASRVSETFVNVNGKIIRKKVSKRSDKS